MQTDTLYGKFHSEDEDQSIKNSRTAQEEDYLGSSCISTHKQQFLDPPRQLPQRSYSLQPDMVNGWKPKRGSKININNVFSIKYEQTLIEQIVKELYKNKQKHTQKLVYLGPRRVNSYELHERRNYDNPYPLNKKQEQFTSGRCNIPLSHKLQQSFLEFNSDFEGGNLDAVIQRTSNEFDLFMRADTNTRGHTNWYYFQINNKNFIGTVKFHICNFRRQKSLYQRGLKPYVLSRLRHDEWQQGGKCIRYERQKPRYQFLYDQQDYILNTFFAMSFEYQFEIQNDSVQFAYCIPYTYSKLLKCISTLNNIKILPALKTLTGLAIPILEITNQEEPQYNKKVILVTGRIHPGESNSSYIAQGFMEYLVSNEETAKQVRKKYIVYILPMLNPDGVIAGNYRTSLFGKDLNRTFNQSRKYAFPETYFLLEFVKQLKSKHKRRFCLYLDLHGHSVKKNTFMYGPDFNIQHQNYEKCRELPKILGNITSLFRYYSCIFRISNEKTTTGRAVMNRHIDIPFTYTMEASNGFYYDHHFHCDQPFTAMKWKQTGMHLCHALNLLKLDQKRKIQQNMPQKNIISAFFEKQEKEESQSHCSDDDISEGNSDSEPSCEDLTDKELKQIEENITGGAQLEKLTEISPSKQLRAKMSNKQLTKNNSKKEKPSSFLPPINALNRAMIFSNRNKKKESLKQERLKLIESQLEFINDRTIKSRNMKSQLESSPMKEDVQTPFNMRKDSRKEWLMKFKSKK